MSITLVQGQSTEIDVCHRFVGGILLTDVKCHITAIEAFVMIRYFSTHSLKASFCVITFIFY